jgi:hypothetical protein
VLHLRQVACQSPRSCLGAYVPWLIGQCAVMLKPPWWQGAQFRAELGWHGWWFFASALSSIRCRPCCVQRTAHLKLLFLGSLPCPRPNKAKTYTSETCGVQRLPSKRCICLSELVPYGACCIPLRAWAMCSSALDPTSHGYVRRWYRPYFTRPSKVFEAEEVFEVTSNLALTRQAYIDPRQLLGPRSPLFVRHAYNLFTRSRRSARHQARR